MSISKSSGPIQVSQVAMIGSIVVTPTTAGVGETVCIEVRRPDGSAYDNTETTPIAINGVPGSKQYVAWQHPGIKAVTVIARSASGRSEKQSSQVTITALPDGATALPWLRARWSVEHPARATLHVMRPAYKGSSDGRHAETTTEVTGSGARRTSVTAVSGSTAGATVSHLGRVAQVSAGAALGVAVGPTHAWTFSDGTTAATMQDSVSHDFGQSLHPDRPYTVVHVGLTLRDPGSAPITIQRSVAVWNPYHLMKRRGVLQPAVDVTQPSARLRKGSWHAGLTVHNPESWAMHLTHQRVELVRARPNAAPAHGAGKAATGHATRAVHARSEVSTMPEAEPAATLPPVLDLDWLAAEKVDIALTPQGDTAIDIAVPTGKVPTDVVALRLHLWGKGRSDLSVRVVAVFDIPEHVLLHAAATPAGLASTLQAAVSSGATASRTAVSAAELSQLAATGVIAASHVADLGGSTQPHVLDSHQTTPNAVAGEVCTPDNLPDVVPDGLYCMPTAETAWVQMPPRFMNASRGDIILSPGDGSIIAQTLAAVDPTQPYSHSGMMTRNLDEITHSTASIDRMTDADSGFVDSGGFRADILKYLWPGAITQTVKDAVDGEKLVDPETGKPYTVGGFGSLQYMDQWTGTTSVAMVVKPDPLEETPAIRAQLHTAADNALSHVGKAHYRFFCYTDPTLHTPAPDEARWAAGSIPTVCSSLVWRSLTEAGLTLEGGLEAADIEQGAQIAPGTPDGLYVYTAEERLNAGEALFGQLEHIALMAAGQLGAAITDIQEDIGNQVLNAFATDWCDGDAAESDAWRNTTDANAVSPQNLMFYDAPHYGYAEPLIYRDERWELVTTYRWKHVTQHGSLKGHVRINGHAVSGADVKVTDALVTHTDTHGAFHIDAVPEGDVIVTAQKVVDGVLWSAQARVTVAAHASVSVDIDLQAPPHTYRRMIINGSIRTTDYEFAAAGYPTNGEDFNGICDLDPQDATHDRRIFTCVADDDTLGYLILTFDLQTDDSIVVSTTLRCYNSDKPDTDDYDEATLDPHTLAAGATVNGYIYVDGTNRSSASFTLTNETNPS